jgi:hypothetical protein
MYSVIAYFLHYICICDCDGRHESLIMLAHSGMVRRSHLLARCYLGTMCMCTTIHCSIVPPPQAEQLLATPHPSNRYEPYSASPLAIGVQLTVPSPLEAIAALSFHNSLSYCLPPQLCPAPSSFRHRSSILQVVELGVSF